MKRRGKEKRGWAARVLPPLSFRGVRTALGRSPERVTTVLPRQEKDERRSTAPGISRSGRARRRRGAEAKEEFHSVVLSRP